MKKPYSSPHRPVITNRSRRDSSTKIEKKKRLYTEKLDETEEAALLLIGLTNNTDDDEHETCMKMFGEIIEDEDERKGKIINHEDGGVNVSSSSSITLDRDWNDYYKEGETNSAKKKKVKKFRDVFELYAATNPF